MKSKIHSLSLRLFACIAIASQLAVACGLGGALNAQEYSGPRWFAQAFESLPMQRPPEEPDETLPAGCEPAPKDLPITALTTDIRPRLDGEVAASDRLPTDCAKYIFTEKRFQSFELSCSSCRLKWCNVLQLAHFCHHPLYFEEQCLEQCGVRSCCCQPAASALHFYGRALMMPMLAVCSCPCSCVPAQYCCSIAK